MCGVGSLIHDSAAGVEIKEASCRSWLCETCAPVRRMQCEIEIRAGEPDAFGTYTLDPSIGSSPNHRAKIAVTAFRKLVRWLRREYSPDLEFWAVFERHKSGEPHLHVVWRNWQFVPQRVLSMKWRQLTGAYIVHVRRVDKSSRAARYIAKYLGKDLRKFGTCRRYWKSAGWVLNRGDETAERWEKTAWRWARESVAELVAVYSKEAWFPVWHDSEHRSVSLRSLETLYGAARAPPVCGVGSAGWVDQRVGGKAC